MPSGTVQKRVVQPNCYYLPYGGYIPVGRKRANEGKESPSRRTRMDNSEESDSNSDDGDDEIEVQAAIIENRLEMEDLLYASTSTFSPDLDEILNTFNEAARNLEAESICTSTSEMSEEAVPVPSQSWMGDNATPEAMPIVIAPIYGSEGAAGQEDTTAAQALYHPVPSPYQNLQPVPGLAGCVQLEHSPYQYFEPVPGPAVPVPIVIAPIYGSEGEAGQEDTTAAQALYHPVPSPYQNLQPVPGPAGCVQPPSDHGDIPDDALNQQEQYQLNMEGLVHMSRDIKITLIHKMITKFAEMIADKDLDTMLLRLPLFLEYVIHCGRCQQNPDIS